MPTLVNINANFTVQFTRTRTSKLHCTYVVGNDVRYSECAANLLGETQPSEVVLTIEYCERLKSFDESGGISEKSVPRSFRPFHCTYRYDEACYQIREGGSNFPHALLSLSRFNSLSSYT